MKQKPFSLLLLFLAITFFQNSSFAQVGIGTSTPDNSAQLEVASSTKGLLLPRMTSSQRTSIGAPVAGLIVYQTDAPAGFYYYNGSAWVQLVPSGSLSLNSLSDAKNGGTNFTNSILLGQTGTGVLSSAMNNTGLGAYSFSALTSGTNNTATGTGALQKLTSGYNNSAIGSYSLYNLTTGFNNVALGSDALQSLTSGYYNVGIGPGALYFTNTGSNNIGIGTASGNRNTNGVYNIAIGDNSLWNNQTGNNNVAVGASALNNVTSGSNTAIGTQSQYMATTGANNTSIGYQALFGLTTGNYNTAIGYQAGNANSTYSNTTTIGNGAQVTGSDQIQLGNSSTTTYVYGTVQSRSDGRDKKDIQNTELGLDFIMSLRPVDYHYDYRERYESGDNDGTKKNEELNHGFVAQEVESVVKEKGYNFGGVNNVGAKGGKDVYYLGYTEFIAPLTKAIQEQQAIIKQQQKEIDELKGMVGKKKHRRKK